MSWIRASSCTFPTHNNGRPCIYIEFQFPGASSGIVLLAMPTSTLTLGSLVFPKTSHITDQSLPKASAAASSAVQGGHKTKDWPCNPRNRSQTSPSITKPLFVTTSHILSKLEKKQTLILMISDDPHGTGRDQRNKTYIKETNKGNKGNIQFLPHPKNEKKRCPSSGT